MEEQETLSTSSSEDNLINELEADEESVSVSSGDAIVTPQQSVSDGSNTVVVTSSSEEVLEVLKLIQETNQAILETNQEILESNQRIELQNEASISVLLFFLLALALNYIYRFLKTFFVW